MTENKKNNPTEKTNLHPRNKHRERYNFKELIVANPHLVNFVHLNKYNDESIDFSNPNAVLELNKSLLFHYYDLTSWSIPKGYLCPPIPSRADYIHYVADLLGSLNNGLIPTGPKVKCLDIGVGANCIYPIVGVVEYGWTFIGSDIDSTALKSAEEIISSNKILNGLVELRLQSNKKDIFNGIFNGNEFFDFTICNPPFHSSFEDAQSGTLRKLKNLNQKKESKTILNFGGQPNELWTVGGEVKFVREMISQSKQFGSSCLWFTTLISKQSNLEYAYYALENINAFEVKTIPMVHGNKSSRILAWTFLNKQQQHDWILKRWK